MSESECKAGNYPDQKVYPDPEEFGRELADKIRRSEMSGEDPRERARKDVKVIEQALAKEENKKQSKSLEQILSLKEKDAEKLLGIIRAIIKDILIEERVATKITVYK